MLQPLNWACKVLEVKEEEDLGERLLYDRPTHTHGPKPVHGHMVPAYWEGGWEM